MNTVRWGLLSTANINRKVIPAIRASQRGTVAAVASRKLELARDYADRWEIPLAFGSYQEMLNSGAVDAVYIALPNHLHSEWSIRALEAGVHVLCEKPFAPNLDDVDRMIAAARRTGSVLAEAFMYRHHVQAKIAGEWVQSGRLGEIVLVRGSFHYNIGERESNVRLVPEYGGGSLWDVGVYPLSMAQYVFGNAPKMVSGYAWNGETGVDERFTGQMWYPGGGMAQISSSFNSPFFQHVDIHGTDGALILTRPFSEMDHNRRLIFAPVKGHDQEISVPEQYLYTGEIEDMQSAILDGTSPYLSLEETRDHVRTVLALYESAKTAQVVQL